MSDIKLTAIQRSNLLQLENLQSIANKSSKKITTGKKIADIQDGGLEFFRSKGLNDRARDFIDRKEAIDQGISTLNTTLNGLEAIGQLLDQIKGLSNSAKSASQVERRSYTRQFISLLNQIGQITNDTQYNGVNLINNTAHKLDIEFGTKNTSKLSVKALNLVNDNVYSQNVDASLFDNSLFNPLQISQENILYSKFLRAYSDNRLEEKVFTLSHVFNNKGETTTLSNVSIGARIPPNIVFSTDGVGNPELFIPFTTNEIGNRNIHVRFGNADALLIIPATPGSTTNFILQAATRSDPNFNNFTTEVKEVIDPPLFKGFSQIGNNNSNIGLADAIISKLEKAITKLRGFIDNYGTQQNILTTRLQFTKLYTNELQTGSDKITLSNLNEDTANLTATQTRIQLAAQNIKIEKQQNQAVVDIVKSAPTRIGG